MEFHKAVFTAMMMSLAHTVSSQSYAQTCNPGPRCQAADAAAQNAIAGWQKHLGNPSTHIASEVAYCTNMSVVEVATICEQEFRGQGKAECAKLAAEQAKASHASAQSALAAASASAASSNWSARCASIGASEGGMEGTWIDPWGNPIVFRDGRIEAEGTSGSYSGTHGNTDTGVRQNTHPPRIACDFELASSTQMNVQCTFPGIDASPISFALSRE